MNREVLKAACVLSQVTVSDCTSRDIEALAGGLIGVLALLDVMLHQISDVLGVDQAVANPVSLMLLEILLLNPPQQLKLSRSLQNQTIRMLRLVF